MREKFFLFLTDEEMILYKESSKKIYSFKENIESVQTKLKDLFSLTPKTPLCLLIDRSHQDIREEQLPHLLLWDRLNLLSHKRETWTSQGGFYGYHFLKQDGKSYLQWVNISQKDSLIVWISWIKSLSNPLCSVVFIPLEAGNFLKKYLSLSHNYQMLIYKISSHKTRYVIFKGKRLLLFRLFQGEENLKASLHFLSRIYTDIHEKLQILSLVTDITLTLPNVTILSDPEAFTNFLTSQEKPSLFLNINPSSQNIWIRKGGRAIFIISLFLIGMTIYQGMHYKRETHSILSAIKTLKHQIQERKVLLNNKNILRMRSALKHYNRIKPQIRNPLKTLEQLSTALDKHHLHLESLTWNNGENVDIEIKFIIKENKDNTFSDQFNVLLSSFAEAFPNSQVHVIEGPFKSSPHETYKYPSDHFLPLTHIRIVLP